VDVDSDVDVDADVDMDVAESLVAGVKDGADVAEDDDDDEEEEGGGVLDKVGDWVTMRGSSATFSMVAMKKPPVFC